MAWPAIAASISGLMSGQISDQMSWNRLPERARVLGAEDLGVGVVVEEAQILAPRHEHREPGLQQEADDGSQRLRPGFRRSERRGGPVVSAHQRAHLSTAGKKLKCPRHARPSGVVPRLAARARFSHHRDLEENRPSALHESLFVQNHIFRNLSREHLIYLQLPASDDHDVHGRCECAVLERARIPSMLPRRAALTAHVQRLT